MKLEELHLREEEHIEAAKQRLKLKELEIKEKNKEREQRKKQREDDLKVEELTKWNERQKVIIIVLLITLGNRRIRQNKIRGEKKAAKRARIRVLEETKTILRKERIIY